MSQITSSQADVEKTVLNVISNDEFYLINLVKCLACSALRSVEFYKINNNV